MLHEVIIISYQCSPIYIYKDCTVNPICSSKLARKTFMNQSKSMKFSSMKVFHNTLGLAIIVTWDDFNAPSNAGAQAIVVI